MGAGKGGFHIRRHHASASWDLQGGIEEAERLMGYKVVLTRESITEPA